MSRNLFIAPYTEAKPERAAEYALCRLRNEQAPFDRIIEVKPTFDDRATYDCFFAAMSRFPDEINVMANLDIWFDETIGLCEPTGRDCYALSRWDSDELFARPDSQDAWVFRGAPSVGIGEGVKLGVPGCDNVIAHLLTKAGFNLSNPSRTIKAHHEHASGIRSYVLSRGDILRYPPPYRLVPPVHLEAVPA